MVKNIVYVLELPAADITDLPPGRLSKKKSLSKKKKERLRQSGSRDAASERSPAPESLFEGNEPELPARTSDLHKTQGPGFKPLRRRNKHLRILSEDDLDEDNGEAIRTAHENDRTDDWREGHASFNGTKRLVSVYIH